MYRKEDSFNLIHTNYELTEMDERIYNETGWVLHQASPNLLEYAADFGSVYNHVTVIINDTGKVEAIENLRTEEDDYDFEVVEVPEELKELMRLKYEEMIRLHPNGERWVEYDY